jgi:CRISPR-associated endonuclease/helicase Cas3
VQPFERLVEQIASGNDAYGRSLLGERSASPSPMPAFRTLSLSATGRTRGEKHLLQLGAADLENATVRRRLNAPKHLTVTPTVASKDLPEALAEAALALVGQAAPDACRCIVFCTSRDHAQKVQQALVAKTAKQGVIVDTELFVGGRRVLERAAAARWLGERGFLAGSAPRERAAIVVATAAGEVGVDLDADHAVCDLVAWERMVQRLGRVNRRGAGSARVVVVPAEPADDSAAAREGAVRQLLAALPRTSDGVIDASPAALVALRRRADLAGVLDAATTPVPLHPPLTLAVVESWAMTSLDEHTGRPEVAPWLRGWPDEPDEPQTVVAWRRYLPVTPTGGLLAPPLLEEFVETAGAHLVEQLEAETWRVADWLRARARSLQAAKQSAGDRLLRPLGRGDVIAVVLDARDGVSLVLRPEDTSDKRTWPALERSLQGATLIVDCRLGGLVNGLLASDSDEPVADVSERDDDGDGGARVVPFRVTRITDELPQRAASGWRAEAALPILATDEGTREWLLVESLMEAGARAQDAWSSTSRIQYLDEHQAWVEAESRRCAEGLGLPQQYTAMLSTAARLHDEGKRAPAWQRAFRAPANGVPPCAKTPFRPDLVGLDGYRHELGSLPYAEADQECAALGAAERELCLHLIAAHHGGARPVLRTSGAQEPPSRLLRRAQDVALRFVSLQQRWGPWGLAWWESILRASDQAASRRATQDGDARG